MRMDYEERMEAYRVGKLGSINKSSPYGNWYENDENYGYDFGHLNAEDDDGGVFGFGRINISLIRSNLLARLNNNLIAMRAIKSLNINTNKQRQSLQRLTSGLRINQSADDAAALAVSEKIRGTIQGLKQASRNVQDGISFLQTADGALSEASSILARLNELSVQKESGTLSANDIDNAKLEMLMLVRRLEDIIQNTQFNGKSIQCGIGICASDNDVITIHIGSNQGESILDKTGIAALIKTVCEQESAFEITTELVKSAAQEITLVRAAFGAQQNRLESTAENIKSTVQNLTETDSRIRDADMASEFASYNKASILVRASAAVLAQANQNPAEVKSLLE